MKKLLPLLLLALTAVLFLGCPLEEDEAYTVQERMDAFIADANAGRWSNLKQHTHPGATMYQESNDVLWETHLIDPVLLELVQETTADFSAGSIDFKAYLEEDGEDNYKIRRIIRTYDLEVIFK